MVDPTGGRGPPDSRILGDLLDSLNMKLLDFPGNATCITYDSGNLPLLEPFRVVRISPILFRALISQHL